MSSSRVQKSFQQAMFKATRLTGVGKLMDATRLIQRTLFGTVPTATPQSVPAANDPHADISPPPVIILPPPSGYQPPPAAAPGRKASFTKHTFTFEGDSYPYRLYVPKAAPDQAASLMPLIVLLHGCKQDALDFSNGTAMNVLAGQHQAMVLYPEQTTSGNVMRCWNWFEPGHQQAGRGEPGMIAALTQKVITQHGADPARIYMAGLSAGGAMAAVVTSLYPDMFAALGVHSGLAAGAAQDLMSAFGAMRNGAKGRKSPALPTIVFHGTADTTVHPDNGEHITDAAVAALKASGLALAESKSVVNSASDQPTERVVYSAADGTPYVESWLVDAGPHAWSGGNAAGSYTDPDGPDASAAMLAFFLRHKKNQPDA